jgi:hypothetical protein
MDHDHHDELDNNPPNEVPPEEKRGVFASEREPAPPLDPTIPTDWKKPLKQYGYIPGIFQLPICYS